MAYEKKKKKRHPLIIIVILALIIPIAFTIISSTLGRTDFNLPHKLVLEVFGPVQGAFTSSIGFFRDMWKHYIDLVSVSKENEVLRLELQKTQAMNLAFREAAATNVSLTKILDLEKSFDTPAVTARIIGRDPALWFKTLTINKGSSSGIQKGMPVVTVEGVVGQVSNISPDYAKVLLSIDPNSAIDAIVQHNRVQGIIKGNGNGYSLQYVLKNAEVRVGDQIITSGLGGTFPKSLAIGKVADVASSRRGMFQKIRVEPAVNFRKLEYVTVVLKKNPLTE
jgi:rod shape-determining protein MreC